MVFSFPILTAEEAAAMIDHGQTVGFSGFTPAGRAESDSGWRSPKRAESEHASGRDFQIGVLTGASTGLRSTAHWPRPVLSASARRTSRIPTCARAINAGETRFFDMHLSMMPQAVRYGFLGPVHWAVIEASDVTAGGGIVLTSSVGAAPTYCRKADKIIIELNHEPSSDSAGHARYL